MRCFTSVSVSASAAGLLWAPAAYACPLCFGSSAPGVLRAYLVSAFFMIGLAWAVIAGIWLYAARMYSEEPQAGDAGAYVEATRANSKSGSFRVPNGTDTNSPCKDWRQL